VSTKDSAMLFSGNMTTANGVERYSRTNKEVDSHLGVSFALIFVVVVLELQNSVVRNRTSWP